MKQAHYATVFSEKKAFVNARKMGYEAIQHDLRHAPEHCAGIVDNPAVLYGPADANGNFIEWYNPIFVGLE